MLIKECPHLSGRVDAVAVPPEHPLRRDPRAAGPPDVPLYLIPLPDGHCRAISRHRGVQRYDERCWLRAVVALRNIQQILPLFARRSDGIGGGTGPIRKIENGLEKYEKEQDKIRWVRLSEPAPSEGRYSEAISLEVRDGCLRPAQTWSPPFPLRLSHEADREFL